MTEGEAADRDSTRRNIFSLSRIVTSRGRRVIRFFANRLGTHSNAATNHNQPRIDIVPTQQVLQLLNGYDGRAWQGQISKELNWSEAKTSRILSKMEDQESLVRERVGRRNVVCLPDDDLVRETSRLREATND